MWPYFQSSIHGSWSEYFVTLGYGVFEVWCYLQDGLISIFHPSCCWNRRWLRVDLGGYDNVQNKCIVYRVTNAQKLKVALQIVERKFYKNTKKSS